MNIMKTHKLGIDECYHWSAHPHWSIPFTTGVNLGVFCRVWNHAGFLSSFPWLNWVMLFHILPLIILSTVRERRDVIALYHSMIMRLPLPMLCPFWVYTILQIMQNSPHLTPKELLWFVSLVQGNVSRGRDVHWYHLLISYLSLSKIFITISHFFKHF